MSLKKSVMAGLRWSAGLRLLGQFFTWAVTIIVIRLLTPGDYGLMALATVFIAFLSMVNEMGLGSAVVQRRNLSQDELRTVLGFIMGASLVICVLLAGGAPIIASFYDEPDLRAILWTLSLIFLFSGLSVVSRSLLLRDLQYKKIAVVELIAATIASVCTLVLALLGMGVWALVGGFLAVRFAMMIGFQIKRPFLSLPRFVVKGMGSIVAFSSQVSLARILCYVYVNAAAPLILGKTLGRDAVGLYGVGLHLASLPMEKVGGIINQVAFPAFSSVQDDPSLAGAHFLKAVRVLGLVTVPVFWGLSSIAPEIIGVFLGDKWDEAIVPMQIIAFVIPFRMVNNLLFPALLGLGRSDVNLRNEMVAAALLPLGFLAGTHWGLVGVSMVWVIVFPMIVVTNLLRAEKVLKLSLFAVFREMRVALFAGAMMYVAVLAIRHLLPIDVGIAVNMLIYIVGGAVVYGSVSLLLNRRVVRELVDLARA